MGTLNHSDSYSGDCRDCMAMQSFAAARIAVIRVYDQAQRDRNARAHERFQRVRT
jgi:hypothetical protein